MNVAAKVRSTKVRSTQVRSTLEFVLRPYAQALLSRDIGTGLLVLLAIAITPRLLALTLIAIVVAQLATMALGLGQLAVREGPGACAAMLTTLALASALGDVSLALIIGAAVLAVLLTAAMQSLLQRVLLPPLALPFVASAWITLLAVRVLPATGTGSPFAQLSLFNVAAPWDSWLNVPASMLYLHGAAAGILVLAAILWHSRIAWLLAMTGVLGAIIARLLFRPGVLWSDVDTVAAFNAMLTAMALGGVWFVPHLSSILLALSSAVITSIVTWALMPVATSFGLPVLSLPFAMTTLLVLLAMRMRERDRWPTSTVPAHHPEDALTAHLMRVRRFGDFAWLPFRLPFRGTWTVTQGHDGAHTHKGAWRFAFDFEVTGSDGKLYEGTGTQLSDFRCYGLPVLAAGTGTVEQIVDGVADNPVGGVNSRENWGNTVVIAHGVNLYSVYSHLRAGSIPLKTGDRVKAGAEVGRCGNSGRSLTPHLHFQVQRGALLGSETVSADFGDVITRQTETAIIAHRVIPREGDRVRPVVRDELLAKTLKFSIGSTWEFVERATGRRESAKVVIDLQSRLILESEHAELYLETYDTGLVVIGFEGARSSLLRSLTLALARIPFDQEATLQWRDRVPRRLLSTWGGAFLDLASVVAPGWTDDEITYALHRSERAVVVDGLSKRFRTQLQIALDGEPHRIEIRQTSGGAASIIEFRNVTTSLMELSA